MEFTNRKSRTLSRSGFNNLKASVLSPDLQRGKIPPQALDLEEAVLGALMIEKDAFARIFDILKPEVFYADSHRDIFVAIQELHTESQPIDILTVSHRLRKNGTFEKVGGAYRITELTNRVASAANIEHHAHIIFQKYIQRELISVCSELQREAWEETTDIFDLLDKAEQELYSLSENNLRRNYAPIDVLVYKVVERMEEMRKKGHGTIGVPTGFRKLDAMTSGWQRSDLIIIAARPAMGKTAFVLTLARNAAIQHQVPVAIFSLEMAAEQLAGRMISAEAEIDSARIRTGQLEPHEQQQLAARIDRLIKAPIYIDDSTPLTIYDLRAKCRRLKSEKNIQMIIIDYLQLMHAGGNHKGGNREQEIAAISRSLKELSKELDVPVIALSQLSRAVEARGGDKRPMLSDLRESGSIEQDADLVLFLFRPEYYGLEVDEEGQSTRGIAEVIIGKQRNGPVGTVKLNYIDRYAKFIDLIDNGLISSGNTGGKVYGSRMNELNPANLSADLSFEPPPF
jgi:replicative DNA helicase